MPSRSGSDTSLGSSASHPVAWTACIAVLPAGSETRRRHRRWAPACTTSTAITGSAIDLVRDAAEIVHHAIGQALETQPEHAAADAGVVEIQRQCHLAA